MQHPKPKNYRSFMHDPKIFISPSCVLLFFRISLTKTVDCYHLLHTDQNLLSWHLRLDTSHLYEYSYFHPIFRLCKWLTWLNYTLFVQTGRTTFPPTGTKSRGTWSENWKFNIFSISFYSCCDPLFLRQAGRVGPSFPEHNQGHQGVRDQHIFSLPLEACPTLLSTLLHSG